MAFGRNNGNSSQFSINPFPDCKARDNETSTLIKTKDTALNSFPKIAKQLLIQPIVFAVDLLLGALQ